MTKLNHVTEPEFFDNYLEKQLKDPEFKKYYDYYGRQLEIAYQVLQLRKKAKMSQADLAKKIGTTQSNVARIESGRVYCSTRTLNKIARAFNKQVKVEFV